ncbi:tRNA (adenosine(37)-N6)-threonylcarbamoyltransferase complex ATPase subunit type 1 TsaE [Lacticigenium naphthae]|uniref:tRNA (adenosine(37)-N6)-threonylcarbamoyltransferase complex ATPase subunit type 1 TsaE n=1 Tax=Lacticigenium naphthae TaxID=515351 RepID=UPI0004151AC9|nr:tRNA (adenosine(37)-N6)-threonylcarbamoyltransferase complex ATPase subunit type 1 TsaE [Lacticigenium naphthae]
MKKITVKNEKETKEIAYHLSLYLKAGDVILLEGDLGMGKTTFTKGLASGLGITRIIKSPTYTIIREYLGGRLPLYHMDVYRIDEEGAEELGLEEYFDGDGVSVIEWASLIESELPEKYISIRFEKFNMDTNMRVLSIEGNTEELEDRLSGFYQQFIKEESND